MLCRYIREGDDELQDPQPNVLGIYFHDLPCLQSLYLKTRQHPQDIVKWGAQCFVFHFDDFLIAVCLTNRMSLGTSRLLLTNVAPLFTNKGLEFKVEYINNIRDWPGTLPSISSLYGAYRRRNIRDTAIVPHSFTFIRRERQLDWLIIKSSYSLAFHLLRK